MTEPMQIEQNGVVYIVIPTQMRIAVIPRQDVREVMFIRGQRNIMDGPETKSGLQITIASTQVFYIFFEAPLFGSRDEIWKMMQDFTFNETDHDITWVHLGVFEGDLRWERKLGRPERTAEEIDGKP